MRQRRIIALLAEILDRMPDPSWVRDDLREVPISDDVAENIRRERDRLPAGDGVADEYLTAVNQDAIDAIYRNNISRERDREIAAWLRRAYRDMFGNTLIMTVADRIERGEVGK